MANTMLGGMPQMNGMSFGGLAQLAKPQMIGNAPIGGGALAGGQFGNDRMMFEALLQMAMQQAQQEQGVRGQAMKEYMDAAPGRGAGINLQNMMGADAVENYKSFGAELGRQEGRNKLNDAQKKEFMDEVGGLIASIEATENDEQLMGVIEDQKQKGKTVFAGFDITNSPPENVRKWAKFMKSRFEKEAQLNPEYIQKKGLEETKVNGRVILESLKQGRADARQLTKIQADAALLEAKMQGRRKDMFDLLERTYPGDSRKQLEVLAQFKVLSQTVEANAEANLMNALMQGSGPRIPLVDPSKAAVLPSATESTKQSKPVLKVGDTWNGKKVTRTGKRNGKQVVQTEDGKIHDVE